MSDLETKIVDTPIELDLIDNILSFRDENEEKTMMESNSYPIKIFTDEILDGCNLVMKRYGSNGLIKIDGDLSFGTSRLIIVSILDTEDKIEKQCWGILEKDLSQSEDIYSAELQEYETVEDYDIIPNSKKISEIITNIFGKIEGYLKQDGEGDFYFLPKKIYADEEDETYINYDNLEGDLSNKEIFDLKGTNEKNEEISIRISIELKKDFFDIPEPPMIDDTLIPPEKIAFNFEEKIIDDSNPLLNGMILSFTNYNLDFSSYEEIEKIFRFNDDIDFSLEENPVEFNPVSENNSTEQINEGDFGNDEPINSELNQEVPSEEEDKTVIIEAIIVSDETVPENKQYFKIKKEVSEDEVGNYDNIFGTLTIDLKISEEDLSKYELIINYTLNIKGLGEIEKVDDEGNFCYNLPEKEYIYEDIQKVETDGTGKYFEIEQPVYIYEIDSSGNPALDEFGRKIPVFERDENGKLILDEEGYAKHKIQLDENGIPKKEMVNEIEYVRDSYGQIVYELIPVNIYERKEDNSLYIDESTNLPIVLSHELNEQGQIIYEKRPTPLYVVNDNNEVQRDENGEMMPVYRRDGTGEILYNDEGEPILAFEKDSYGFPILDEENEMIPLYEKIEDFDENGNIIIVNKKGIVGWKSKVDLNGNIIYIKENEKEKTFSSNFVQKYEKEIINGKEYYKVGEDGNLIPILEQDGKTPIYEKDGNGEKIIISDFKQLMEKGEVILNSQNEIVNTINAVISYDNFAYLQEKIDKADFVPEDFPDRINSYIGRIKSENLPSGTEKILLGIAKYDKADDSIKYATNGLEIKITRSIQTMVWDPELEFLNEKIVIAKYDPNKKWYYELIPTTNSKVGIEGRENYIYIDPEEIEIEELENGKTFSKIIIRKWRPDEGFYELKLAAENNLG